MNSQLDRKIQPNRFRTHSPVCRLLGNDCIPNSYTEAHLPVPTDETSQKPTSGPNNFRVALDPPFRKPPHLRK